MLIFLNELKIINMQVIIIFYGRMTFSSGETRKKMCTV